MSTRSSFVLKSHLLEYTVEQEFDQNAKQFQAEIEAVHNVSPEGFAAIKVTALGNPQLLQRWSNSLVEIRNLFSTLDANSDGRLQWEEFQSGYNRLFSPIDTHKLRAMFERFLDDSGSDQADRISWTSKLRLEDGTWLAGKCLESGPFHKASLSQQELLQMARMVERIRALALRAKELDVRLMIDAEHSYFQPAIDHIVLNLQGEFNTQDAVVYNTYQCYLKEARNKLKEHIIISEREGFAFACKLGKHLGESYIQTNSLAVVSP